MIRMHDHQCIIAQPQPLELGQHLPCRLVGPRHRRVVRCAVLPCFRVRVCHRVRIIAPQSGELVEKMKNEM